MKQNKGTQEAGKMKGKSKVKKGGMRGDSKTVKWKTNEAVKEIQETKEVIKRILEERNN